MEEATDYTALWSALNREWWTYEESVRHARDWLTDHQDVVDQLLRNERERNGQGR